MYSRVLHPRRKTLGMIGVSLATAVIALPASALPASARPASNAVAGGAHVDAGGKQTHEVDTWAASPADIGGVYSDTTVRNIVHTNIGGSGLRVRLSNAFGSKPATFDDVQVGRQSSGAATIPGSNRRVTFSGQTSVTIPKGAEALSDPLPGTVSPSANLAVSVHFTGFTGEATGHPDAQQDNYASPAGDVAGNDNPSAYFPNTYGTWYFVDGLVLDAPKQTGEVVALGDSITDGYKSTVNANRRWPDDLARRLLALPAPQQLSVANEGISANDVTADRCPGCGVSAESRLDRDVLSQPGVSTVIFLEGINDIGSGAVTSADQLIAADKQIIARTHARGLRILGGTLTPIKGAGFTAQQQQIREAVNQWIRTSGAFDGVVDFDKATRDPADPQAYLPAYDSGDHLHPNDAGYQAMANAVDIAALRQPSTTTLSASPNAGVGVAGVALFATIKPTTAGGTVAFTDNTTPIPGCAAIPVTTGAANCVTTFTTGGPHTITATYTGDPTHTGSTTSTALTVTTTPNVLQIALGYLISFAHTFHLFGL